MSKEQIQQKIIEIAAERVGANPADLTPATHFVNDLNFDSLEAVEFTMEVEDEFKISVPDEQVEKLTTVGAVVDFVGEQLKAAPAAS